MNATQKPKPSSHLVLTTIISGSLTCVLSFIYTTLCILALIFRFDCNAGHIYTIRGSAHMLNTVYRIYFQDGECWNGTLVSGVSGITSEYSVFVLVVITLAASITCIISACALMTVVTSQSAHQYINIFAYMYIGVCIASLIVDLTFASHFGMDYTHLSQLLDNFSPGLSFNYDIDIVRIGAFLLMAISLKGFISHAVNLVLLILLVIYLIEYSKTLDQYEHSIHKLGVIKAFDPRKPGESMVPSRCDNCQGSMVSNGGPHLNHGFLNEEEPSRNLTRENSRREDYHTPAYDRSYSWQHGPTPAPRPFSYLEEGKRHAPPRSPSSVAGEPQWRRNQWQGTAPPVPAPDYSPHAPRKLKSALKPGYM